VLKFHNVAIVIVCAGMEISSGAYALGVITPLHITTGGNATAIAGLAAAAAAAAVLLPPGALSAAKLASVDNSRPMLAGRQLSGAVKAAMAKWDSRTDKGPVRWRSIHQVDE
jgi:hypothetical protein